jgi:hypothetical protein
MPPENRELDSMRVDRDEAEGQRSLVGGIEGLLEE